MGMYTVLVLNVRLKKDLDPNVQTILINMVDGHEGEYDIPDHLFFQTPRWEFLGKGSSYYFDEEANSYFTFDKISQQHTLGIQSNLKNYGDEIDYFLDWISQYVDSFHWEFKGYKRYEEWEDPQLIYWDSEKSKLVLVEIKPK